MSKLITNTIRHTGGSADNITLDNSQNVTVEGNATVDGTSTLTGNVTCSGQLKTDAIRHTGASSDAITLASDGTATAKITNYPHRNLVINGDMRINQRRSSSTTTNQYVCDRFRWFFAGHDETPTCAKVDLTSSDTGPWEKGFRHALQITNGNQTGGAGAADECSFYYQVEAQDIANSGWDYTSASSYITLSFWLKSSVAQNFYSYLATSDGSSQMYLYETGDCTANTWKKVVLKIPGNSNIQIDNNTEHGFAFSIAAFWGSDYTVASPTLNAWTGWSGSARAKDNETTWWTTNDATFAITGVQLEVSDYPSEFEHRSYGDELARCQRYYEHSYNTGVVVGANSNVGGYYQSLTSDAGGNATWSLEYKVQKRAVPTMTFYRDDGTSGSWDFNGESVSAGAHTVNGHRSSQTHLNAYMSIGANWDPCFVYGHWTSSAEL